MRLALSFALLLATPVFAETAEVAVTATPRPVVSAVINPQTGEAVQYVGIVAANAETDLGFPMIGTIAERPVSIGDQVARGDVLARLDPEDLEADVRAAEAGVSVATAQLRAANDAAGRALSLAGRGVDSATQVEDTQRALTAAQSRLAQAEASLARANDMRNLAILQAPQDGVITQTFAEAGAALTSGQPVVRFATTNAREVEMDLGEADVAGIDLGTRFDVSLNADPSIAATARLTRIDPVTERSTRTRRLHLTLDNPPEAFRLGALVNVRLAASAESGVSIDLNAVLDPDGDASVWVVNRTTNTASRRAVTLGERFGGAVRILSGLQAGDEVILKGIHSVKEGQIVGPRVTE